MTSRAGKTRSDVRGTKSEASLASRARATGEWTTICRVSTIRAKARAERGRHDRPEWRARLLASERSVEHIDLAGLQVAPAEPPRRGRHGRRGRRRS